jgi:integrase
MAQIHERKSPTGKVSWRVRVRLKGQAPQTSTFASKTKAVLWAQQMEADIRAGRAFLGTEARRRTLADLLARYREEILPQYSPFERRKRELKLSWWETQLGYARLADLTPARIAEYRTLLANHGGPSGRPAAPATQIRYLAALSHVLSFAVHELDWLDSNPVRKVRRPREPRGRVRYLSPEERDRLLAACKASAEPRLYALLVLAVGTGARQSELLRLRWPDVDLQRCTATIHETKNDERRTLVLAGRVLEVLRDHGTVRRIGTDLVFANDRGVAAFPRVAWEQALDAAKIEDFRFHDNRHTFASYLAMSGATLAELAEALGHKTLAMVKRYAHLSEQHTSRVVGRMVQGFLG